MNILIVDDTETNRMVLVAMLLKDGHAVSEATNGREGVALFEREQPDLVIMDIMMPVLTDMRPRRSSNSAPATASLQ
jgi:Response regulator containing CheY-like receiver domain and AraC-type DNA-binding domain